MSLLELLFGEGEGVPEAPERPGSLALDIRPLSVYAPVTGTTMPMADIPDPVFASGAMGQTVGIKPDEGVVYAPVSGTVTLITHTLHAIGLESDEGLQILIHLGVDTVKLRGDGLHGFVQQGQHVKAGEPLAVMNLVRIAEAGYSDVVITAVSNSEDFASVTIAEQGCVSAGDRILYAQR